MAKSIMIQGTMSNAGKSLITAGLLRVLVQDGYKVAPFKSQNMALNSFITDDGLEMGRAQVMQAEAAGILPHISMNPVLLKPNSDMNSQLIVNGCVRGNISAKDYFDYKPQLIPDIMEAYGFLQSRYDIIVIEGAGSPAEINLKENDIVNMGLAKLVDAPVILVGDIDRGGVFAQLYGTVALLEKEEQDRIAAFIINKFRGDKAILDPGLAMLYELCGKRIAGVVPYLTIDIDEEDSLTERFKDKGVVSDIDIAVIKLPRISNFTDFARLEASTGVALRYVDTVRRLNSPDLIIIPGTKNTIEDLKWLRESGLEALINKYAAKGGFVIGICGGYQMLGGHLADNESGEAIKGLGLLPVDTVFQDSKTRTRVEGTVECIEGCFAALTGVGFTGYEIHMGETERKGPGSAFSKLTYAGTEKYDGMVKNNIIGTYVHGLFDSLQMCESVVKLLYQQKGLNYESGGKMELAQYKNIQYDILANGIRDNIDMQLIYEMINR